MPTLEHHKPQHTFNDDGGMGDFCYPSGVQKRIADGLIIQIEVGFGFKYIVQGQKLANNAVGQRIAQNVQDDR